MKGRKWLAFLSCVFAMPLCTQMLPGISADPVSAAVLAGALLGVIYLVVRPVLRLLTFPLGCLTLGLSGFMIDTALILLLARMVPGFSVAGVEWAAMAAFLVGALTMITGGIR